MERTEAGYKGYARYRGSVETDDIDEIVRVAMLAESLYVIRVHMHAIEMLRKSDPWKNIKLNSQWADTNIIDSTSSMQYAQLVKLTDNALAAAKVKEKWMLEQLVGSAYEPVDFMPYDERMKRKDG